MAGVAPAAKLEDEVLRKFYRSFHKHGAGNWPKIAKDIKIPAEQCEMLHKQHMSFLSLPASDAFETAFLALVNDHYNATQNQLKEEVAEDDAPRGVRAARREAEEPEAHVTTSISQKPKRTPKPTPQRLAAEEEMQARRLARANQGTPKSARAKMMAKAPPSPPAGEWNSPQRKRTRRLFEDGAEPDASRYRSPVVDRWRGRHNTDVDEGVDALLSLASGAHPSSNIEEHPSAADVATTTADAEEEADTQAIEHLPAAAKRPRGGRGGRSTPTPTGTPVKGSARAASAAPAGAAAADAFAGAGAAGIRSPKARGAAAAATASGRAGSVPAGRSKKEQRESPTTSSQHGGEAGEASAAAGAEVSDGGAPGPHTAEEPVEEAATEEVKETHEAPPDGAAAEPVPVSASGRPVRKRKPTAIALAAAAAAEEEEAILGGRGARGVVAAIAAAVAATGATLPDAMAAVPMPETVAAAGPPDAGASSQSADMLSNTAALLAGVPPVRTRASARIADRAPGSRRAAELFTPPAASPPPAAAEPAPEEAPANEATTAGDTAQEEVPPQEEEPAAEALEVKAEAEEDEAASGPSAEAALAAEAPPAPPVARGRGKAAAAAAATGQMPLQATAPSIRLGPARTSALPPPGRRRRRKALPERLPPLFESLKVTSTQTGAAGLAGLVVGAGTAATIPTDGVPPAAATSTGADAQAPDSGAAGAGPSSSAAQPPLGAGATALSMPAAELALRHCLGPRVRRWCMYEFFYSALDRPWFMRNELLEFCMHLQLPTTKLTRHERSTLRSALGRPRRLSLAFLRDERLRLEGYRENARLKYDEVAMGMEVPPELPRQLRVGQEVTARHPVSRQLHDGVILTVKGSKYRVQFHRSELMTEVVRDTELMPLDPHECMPQQMSVAPSLLNGRPYDAMRLAGLRGGLVPGMALPPLAMGFRPMGTWASSLDTQMMREQDAAMLSEVQQALEVKEGLVAQLTQLNNEAASGLHSDEKGACSERFQLQYTGVVLQLKEINAVLENAMSRLQSRQQQIVVGSNIPLGAALALQQQQQQLLGMPAAGAGAVGVGAGPAVAAAGAPQQVATETAGLLALPPLPLPQLEAQPLPPPLPLPASSSPPPPSPTVATGSAGQCQQQQPPPARAAGAMTPTPGRAPLSPSPPIVVPPPRPSAAPTVAQPGLPPLASSTQLSLPAGANAEQLVEHSFAEARRVVDSKRYSDGLAPQPLVLGPPASQQVPVIAPIVAMQMQPSGGAPVPLILPPGAVLPQQVVGQQQQTAGDQATAAAQQSLPSGGEAGGDGGHSALATNGLGMATASSGVQIKVEGGGADSERPSAVAVPPSAEGALVVRPQGERRITEEEMAEHWLRDVIVGCVGMLFTIQRCTAGGVPAGTVAEALDLAVKQLQIKTQGENDGLYRDIVQSVQGLKDYLTRALT